ncbi:uncharacterized protein LOC129800695 [Phlebotomus papatasi]|uniref:uncharacterized protein LOC129800695 n=1 Tax=Phlebotomus papatasi TaxID=29031 RepID=UPI0024845A54|nr:uncharacterized protein LOC129800695 [Phlebotomus papatasi]
MVFDRIVIQFMDSFVWCFLLLVSANCMIRITTAHHEKVLVEAQSVPLSSEAPVSPGIFVDERTTEAIKENTSPPASRDLPVAKDSPQSRSQRLELLDNIFNIPIATLKAVNELVQSIASNFHVSGVTHVDHRSIKDSPARTTEKSNQ